MMRSLIQNNCPAFLLQLLKHIPSFPLIRRQKPLKAKTPGTQSRQCQSSNASCRPRQRSHRNPGLLTKSHQSLPRIRDSRSTRIRNQCHILPLLHQPYQIMRLFHPIILMITGHCRLYLKMIQQFNTIPGILRRNNIHIPQRIQHPKRHILQITYRRST